MATLTLSAENCYVTLEEAENYFIGRLDSNQWDDTTMEEKKQSLVTATRLLDFESYSGVAVDVSQPLAFPRTGSYYDPKIGSLIEFDDGIPKRIKQAVYELAYHLLTNDNILDQSSSVEEIKIDTIMIKKVRAPSKINATVYGLIAPLLEKGSSNIWWRAN